MERVWKCFMLCGMLISLYRKTLFSHLSISIALIFDAVVILPRSSNHLLVNVLYLSHTHTCCDIHPLHLTHLSREQWAAAAQRPGTNSRSYVSVWSVTLTTWLHTPLLSCNIKTNVNAAICSFTCRLSIVPKSFVFNFWVCAENWPISTTLNTYYL